MSQRRKAFHFDLDSQTFEQNGAPKNAWAKVQAFMESHGFEHIQRSGYESKHGMAFYEALAILEELQDELPWFASCARDAKLTNVSRNHDILAYFRARSADKEDPSNTPNAKTFQKDSVEPSEVSLDAEVKDMQEVPPCWQRSLSQMLSLVKPTLKSNLAEKPTRILQDSS